eukprot:CAMPEP_0171290056 /NCGR_PEP_ID=MMETSP0790-20130122/70942_1 /TAXON_ID=2925 /ORGANISM="Alexandrium catenella, Strain OF101" /LENGTH=40 /DNA_ID= /DNA_START= /DNA_END= /DNA_ORIENTATION=
MNLHVAGPTKCFGNLLKLELAAEPMKLVMPSSLVHLAEAR